MLSEVCHELKNWFDVSQLRGKFEVKNGIVTIYQDSSIPIANGQYFRIVGSIFNDGVWKYDEAQAETSLVDEIFDGAVWLLAIPKEVIALSDDIDAWKNKYLTTQSVAMSPFNSESFGGYSYSKSSGGDSAGGGGVSWQSTFAKQLNRWRKI